jgi:hypothetical protein
MPIGSYLPTNRPDSYTINAQAHLVYCESWLKAQQDGYPTPYVKTEITGSFHFYCDTPSNRQIVGIKDITVGGGTVDLNDVSMASGGPIAGGQGVQWFEQNSTFKIVLQYGGPLLFPATWYGNGSVERTYEITIANGQTMQFEIFVRGFGHLRATDSLGINRIPNMNNSDGSLNANATIVLPNGDVQYNPAIRFNNIRTPFSGFEVPNHTPISLDNSKSAEIGRPVTHEAWEAANTHHGTTVSGFSYDAPVNNASGTTGYGSLNGSTHARTDNWAYSLNMVDADDVNRINLGHEFYHGKVYFKPAFGSGPGTETNFQEPPFRTELFSIQDPSISADSEQTAIFCYETIDHAWQSVKGLGTMAGDNTPNILNHEIDNTTTPSSGPRSYRRSVGYVDPAPYGNPNGPYEPYWTNTGVPSSVAGLQGDFGLGSYRGGAWGTFSPASTAITQVCTGTEPGHYTAAKTVANPNNATPLPSEGFKAIWIGGGETDSNSLNALNTSYDDVVTMHNGSFGIYDFDRRVVPMVSMILKVGNWPQPPPGPCQTNPLILDASNTSSSNCTANGASDGTASVNETALIAALNTAPFTYTWNGPAGVFGGNSNNQTGLAPGVYTVEVVDANGCTDSISFTIVEPPPPPPCDIRYTAGVTYGCSSAQLNFTADMSSLTPVVDWVITVQDPNGNNLNPGTLTIPGGAGAYGLPGATGGVPINGTYTYTITDSNDPSCSVSGTILNVNIPTNTLSVAATSTDSTAIGADDGTATGLISGGATPFNYSWSNGQTGQSITGLAPGNYTLTVVDKNGCSGSASVVIEEPLSQPLNAQPLEVCLNLDTGKFDFIDKNDYFPSGTVYPYRIAITIDHGNGVNVYPGSLSSPDIFSDSDLSTLRTYDGSIQYGLNSNISIPTSGPNYISDIYKITTVWNFSGGNTIDHTTVSYVNAQGLQLFEDLTIKLNLKYSCAGDLTSFDKTDYSLNGIPYSLTRTHELFAPVASGLPSPAYSSGQAIINSDLYEGTWTSSITSHVVWSVPQLPVLGVVYDPLCVKKTFYKNKTINVSCYIDPCVVHHHSKKIKNKYDAAVCDRDIVKIKEYRFKYQRLIELLKIYIIGELGDCAEDYTELWKMLEITNLDKITNPDCCGDPSINQSLIADGKGTYNSATDCSSTDANNTSTNGGGGGGNPDDPSSGGCPCIENAVAWTQGQQASGVYVVGDYVNFTTATGDIMCFQLYAAPSIWRGIAHADFPLQSPLTDLGQYWEYLPCDGDGGTPTFGCTDIAADNYNPDADYDDGSCIYSVSGCIDPLAINYNPLATIDDGSCVYCIYGCVTPGFLEFDPSATCDDGSCLTACIYGCTAPLDANYNALATCDDGSCFGSGVIAGCTDPIMSNYNPLATVDDGSCTPVVTFGCTDPTADNYNSTVNVDDGSCVWFGCTDAAADNYDATATVDDGTCTYSGLCTGNLTVPDDNFEAYLEGIGYSDLVLSNNTIDIAGTGVPSACDLQDMNATAQGISDLTGLTQFTSLVNLRLTSNPFSSIDVTAMPNLQALFVDNTQLTSIDLSNNTQLTLLRIGYNPNLTSIDLSNNVALTSLTMPSTGLTGTVDVSANVNLNMIDVTSNPAITSLVLGSSIDLNTLSLHATGLNSSATIKVGSSGRVTLATSLFTVGNGSISTGTTFIV